MNKKKNDAVVRKGNQMKQQAIEKKAKTDNVAQTKQIDPLYLSNRTEKSCV